MILAFLFLWMFLFLSTLKVISLDVWFFVSSSWKICHFLLTSMVSDEKSAVAQLGFLLQERHHFSLFERLVLCPEFPQFLFEFHWVSPIQGFLSFMNLKSCTFCKIWGSFQPLFLIFFQSHRDTGRCCYSHYKQMAPPTDLDLWIKPGIQWGSISPAVNRLDHFQVLWE